NLLFICCQRYIIWDTSLQYNIVNRKVTIKYGFYEMIHIRSKSLARMNMKDIRSRYLFGDKE
ncbi:hypothetical protein T02_4198, partial [Trichinella nativa]